MGKGNLYTHVHSIEDEKITILSRLKFLYQCSPRDYQEIKLLKEKLFNVEKRNKKRNKHIKDKKPYRGLFY